MTDPTWYLGPPGDLRELPTPEPGMDFSTVRSGGVHQALSGARVVDVLGHRAEITLTWDYLDRAEWVWLQALHERHIPGPLRLLHPLKRNRLSPAAASCRFAEPGRYGVTLTEGFPGWGATAPEEVALGGRVLTWQQPAGGIARWDATTGTAVFGGQTVTASVYARAAPAVEAELVLDCYAADGSPVEALSEPVTVATAWQRLVHTVTVPSGTATVALALVPVGEARLDLAAAQLEAGDMASAWEPGGGAPVVAVDQLSTQSPRFPLTDCSLTLLEV